MHLRCKYWLNLNTPHEIFQLTFHFKLRFFTKQSVSFPFILNSHTRGIGPTILVFDRLWSGRVEVFVSLCSYSTSRDVRSSEHIGAETFVKNNGESCLAYRIERAYERRREESHHFWQIGGGGSSISSSRLMWNYMDWLNKLLVSIHSFLNRPKSGTPSSCLSKFNLFG